MRIYMALLVTDKEPSEPLPQLTPLVLEDGHTVSLELIQVANPEMAKAKAEELIAFWDQNCRRRL